MSFFERIFGSSSSNSVQQTQGSVEQPANSAVPATRDAQAAQDVVLEELARMAGQTQSQPEPLPGRATTPSFVDLGDPSASAQEFAAGAEDPEVSSPSDSEAPFARVGTPPAPPLGEEGLMMTMRAVIAITPLDVMSGRCLGYTASGQHLHAVLVPLPLLPGVLAEVLVPVTPEIQLAAIMQNAQERLVGRPH
jgi:hypothetical protein